MHIQEYDVWKVTSPQCQKIMTAAVQDNGRRCSHSVAVLYWRKAEAKAVVGLSGYIVFGSQNKSTLSQDSCH
jgi:hypothetical protein